MSDDPADTPKKEELPGGDDNFSLDPSSDAGPDSGEGGDEFMSFEEFSQLGDDSPAEDLLNIGDAGDTGDLGDAGFADLDTGLDASFDESELEEFASFDDPEGLDFDEGLDMDVPETPPAEALEGLDEVPAEPIAAPDSIEPDVGADMSADLEMEPAPVPEAEAVPAELQADGLEESLDEGLSVDPSIDIDSGDSLDDEDWDGDLDEDWDQDEEGEESSGEKKPKKESKDKKPIELSFNTIVIGGGVVLGVGVLAFQILTTEPTVQKEETIQSALTMTGAIGNPVLGERGPGEQVPPENAGQSSAGAGQGFLNNPDALKQAQQQTQSSEVSPSTSLAPNSNAGSPGNVGGAPTIPPQPAPMTTDSRTSSGTITRNNSGQRLTANASVNNEALEKLSNQLETLSGEMDKVSQRIGNLESKVSTLDRPSSNASQQDSAAIEQMRQSLNSLRNQVGSLETNVAQISSTSQQNTSSQNSQSSSSGRDMGHLFHTNAGDGVPPSNDSGGTTANNTQNASGGQNRVAAVPRAPGQKPKSWETTIPLTTESTQGGGTSVGSLVKWRLRSAQPGRAWVSRLGDNAITMIRVGNTLPGVGRITAINSVNGRWVVRGEQAVITQ